jgi:hypothetical protein
MLVNIAEMNRAVWNMGLLNNDSGGKKFDSEKPPMTLISRRAQEEEAKVLAFGAKKYDKWNWSRGIAWSRVLDAAIRHLIAFADGEDVDPETGLSHLAHARCCTGFLLDYEKEHPELDDRRPRAKNLAPARKDHTLLTHTPGEII